MIRTCMVKTCGVPVGRRHVMCVRHWQSLPGDVQRAAQERINGWRDEGAARILLAPYARRFEREGA